MPEASYWIEKYEMVRHPEGGYFKETYRSSEVISDLPKRFTGSRSVSTSIYFLLEAGDFSAFHKILSDEVWHFYTGDALEIFYFDNQNELQIIKLGNNAEIGEVFQAVVPAGSWFGSKPALNSKYSLVGCTVAPGFDFQDFEMAEQKLLLKAFPHYSEIISQLTHS